MKTPIHLSLFAEERPHTYHRLKATRRGMLPVFLREAEEGFVCKQCGAFVSSAIDLAGVLNRNHCPYCLWSRHLDLYQAGDRMNACRGLMRPAGLVQKRRLKKYISSHLGELALLHLCTECAGFSLNRLAADDNPQMVMDVFDRSAQLDESAIHGMASLGILLIDASQHEEVCRQLFGWRK